eukprot:CAMPEP_0202874032 /NCGR_PEP_ID=MMETSP1391-20130828/24577_1 /ASSEMBLY_ACC=CAM_ASM_000867 /TAXON_ID=1034604 /ORGANISM="Chlamydomonas leiostraca, Strain SAG 11-49" /LENGTH=80 /DNA_ID=CAMNT_0049555377 /DNA_START=35 /DNA_END=274 /DNA_ORIENTATION=+
MAPRELGGSGGFFTPATAGSGPLEAASGAALAYDASSAAGMLVKEERADAYRWTSPRRTAWMCAPAVRHAAAAAPVRQQP